MYVIVILERTVQAIEKSEFRSDRSFNGYYVEWSGQYENLIRGQVNAGNYSADCLLDYFSCPLLAFKSIREVFLNPDYHSVCSYRRAYIIYFYGVHLSVAVAVGL